MSEAKRKYEAVKKEHSNVKQLIKENGRKIQRLDREIKQNEKKELCTKDLENMKFRCFEREKELQRKANDTFVEEQMAVNEVTVEREVAQTDTMLARRNLNDARYELSKKQFEANLKEKEVAAHNQLAVTRLELKGKSDLSLMEAKTRAAELQYEWEQRKQERLDSNNFLIDLEHLKHDNAVEVLQLNNEASNQQQGLNHQHIVKQVTHKTNEKIREATAMLQIYKSKKQVDTFNAIRLLIAKHKLEKDMVVFNSKNELMEKDKSFEEISTALDRCEKRGII